MMDESVRQRLIAVEENLRGLSEEAKEFFFESMERHAYSSRLDAHHSVRNVLVFGAERTCSKTDLIVLSGRDVTNGSGEATLLLDALLCNVVTEGLQFGDRLVMTREPHFVATPYSRVPAFITVLVRSTKRQAGPGEVIFDRAESNIVPQRRLVDVTVDITAWKHDGAAAGKTDFSWICTIEAARLRSF